MSVLISVPIDMAISQYSNLNHACVLALELSALHLTNIRLTKQTREVQIALTQSTRLYNVENFTYED